MTPTTERRRTRTAFRIVAGTVGVVGLALSAPFAVTSFIDDAQSIHRLHNLVFTGLYGVLLGVALLACAWRPEENVSAFFVAVASGIAGAIAGLASGEFISGVWYAGLISIVVLWALHPLRRELFRASGVDLPTALLSLVALAPAIAWLLTQSDLQRTGQPGDPHWEFHHYSGMAAVALALPVCGLAASLRESGRRLGAWLVGVSAGLVGAGSLALSGYPGALDGLWAWLTLAWGVAIIVLAETGSRGTRSVAS
jgi:hypothetical protein